MTPTDPTPPGGPSDQRAGRRVDLRRRVSLKFKDFQGFVNEYLENISAGGMFIRTTSPPPVGTVFDFELTLEDYSRLVYGLGEVVWVREHDEGFDRPAGIGVRFLSLEPESSELIERLLARLANAEASVSAALAPPDLDAEEPWWEDRPLTEPEPPAEPQSTADAEPAAGAAEEEPGRAAPPERPSSPPLPPPSPYAYARSYHGSAVARPGRRPRPLLLVLLIVVVLVALAAAALLLFPDAAMRWLLGDERRAGLENGTAPERVEVAAEPVAPVPPSEAGEEDAGAETAEDAAEPEIGFFEPSPEPAPADPPDRAAAPEPAPPPAPPSPAPSPAEPPAPAAGAERAYSRVLNVLWEPAGEATAVTVFLDGQVQEWDYTVDRLEAPPRAVVRIQGVDRPFPRSAIPVGTGLVERIRLGFHPDRRESELHLVLDLATPEAEVVRSEAAGSEIRLRIARGEGG